MVVRSAGLFLVPLLAPFRLALCAGLPCQQVSRVAPQRAAELAQYVRPIHSAAVVVQPQQCWVADAAFVLQSQERPFSLPQKLSEPANNLGVGHPVRLARAGESCKIYFTTVECRAILGSVSRRSIYQLCLLWDNCVKVEKRASQALGAALCTPVRLVRLWGIAVPAALWGLWRTSWAVKIGAGRHGGGVYCVPGGGLRVR